MGLIFRAKHLFFAGFFILLVKQPLRYFLGPGYLIVSLIGIILCSLVLLHEFEKIRFSKKEWVVVLSFLLMAILDCLLLVIGKSGEFDRNLWFSGICQLLMSSLFLYYAKSPSTWRFLKFSLSAVLAIELALAFLQISYYSIGVGLPPAVEDYEEFSFVSGSFANANDFSVFVAASCMALYSCWTLEGKNIRGYVFLGLSAMGVFVSLSRTVFLFMLIFIALALLQSGKIAIRAPKKKSNIFLLGVISLICLAFIFIISSDFLVGTSVFERSIARIGQVGEITSDDSSAARSVVYIRFLENFFNLGWGTFADLNYSVFFEPGDFYLMAINPHSFLVEMSFLYGWLGLIAAVCLMGALILGILRNSELPISVRCLTALSLIFFQSVPSSILISTSFFVPYLILMCCSKRFFCKNFDSTGDAR
ncbi:O-antigen ligase family protein [Variovorax boronicumulans]